ncbi:MAG: hypothetical protein RIC80_05020 [Cyclobacteriaceae bacterium]
MNIMHIDKALLLLLSLMILGCQPNSPESISIEDIDFMTNDASEIFFKNVRQSYYDKQEIAAAGMDVFRMSDRNDQADYPLINFAIAYNWRNDQAFLMVEPNEHITNPEEFQLLRINLTSQDTTIIRYAMGNMKDQVTFAHRVFQALTAEDRLYFYDGQVAKPIFDKFEDREVLRKTVLDYYKLINLIR